MLSVSCTRWEGSGLGCLVMGFGRVLVDGWRLGVEVVKEWSRILVVRVLRPHSSSSLWRPGLDGRADAGDQDFKD